MSRMRYLLGIVTLVVMVASGYFLFRLLEPSDAADRYTVEVTFLDARNLKPGADLKYRGIRVGSVRDITVDSGEDRARVLLQMDPGHEALVRQNSKFWIVTPRFHGISLGVSGLDTLVRDSYVAFSVPSAQRDAPELPNGSRVIGAESPGAKPLPEFRRGDLSMRVLLPENHGVTVGTSVMFRGMPTGEVRTIRLAPNGTHVIVTVRIASNHRSTVTDSSVFWVAQPRLNLQFSFTNPVSVNELGSLLKPHIAYYTAPRAGVPVPDGYVVAALMKRPSLEVTAVPKEALTRRAPVVKPENRGPMVLVRVVYAAEDVDWLTPNDTLHRDGTGILFLDAKQQAHVLTARSVCDAAYYHKETLGWSEIQDERIRVQLGNGQALTASRVWVPEDGTDLAILRVSGLPLQYPTSKPEVFQFLDAAGEGPLTLHVCSDGGALEDPLMFDVNKAESLDPIRGGVLVRDGKVLGLVGQKDGDDVKTTVVTFDKIPAAVRPTK